MRISSFCHLRTSGKSVEFAPSISRCFPALTILLTTIHPKMFMSLQPKINHAACRKQSYGVTTFLSFPCSMGRFSILTNRLTAQSAANRRLTFTFDLAAHDGKQDGAFFPPTHKESHLLMIHVHTITTSERLLISCP